MASGNATQRARAKRSCGGVRHDGRRRGARSAAPFAVGAAVGDLTRVTFRLGLLASGIMFTVAVLVPPLAGRLGANPALFWVTSILTRPLAAP